MRCYCCNKEFGDTDIDFDGLCHDCYIETGLPEELIEEELLEEGCD